MLTGDEPFPKFFAGRTIVPPAGAVRLPLGPKVMLDSAPAVIAVPS